MILFKFISEDEVEVEYAEIWKWIKSIRDVSEESAMMNKRLDEIYSSFGLIEIHTKHKFLPYKQNLETAFTLVTTLKLKDIKKFTFACLKYGFRT